MWDSLLFVGINYCLIQPYFDDIWYVILLTKAGKHLEVASPYANLYVNVAINNVEE